MEILFEKTQQPNWFSLNYLLFVFIVFFAVYSILKNKAYIKKHCKAYLLGVWIIITVTELSKILLFMKHVDRNWLNIFPFHLCSLPIYMTPIVIFTKNKYLRLTISDFLVSIIGFGAAASFLQPGGLLHDYLFLTFHSLHWHACLVILAFILLVSDYSITEESLYRNVWKVYAFVSAIALVFNIYLKDKSYINLFFMSPYKPTTIIIFNRISELFGNVPSSILFFIALGATGHGIFKLLQMAKEKLPPDFIVS